MIFFLCIFPLKIFLFEFSLQKWNLFSIWIFAPKMKLDETLYLIWSYKIRFTDLVEGTEALPPLMSIKKLKIKAEFSADVLTNMESAL